MQRAGRTTSVELAERTGLTPTTALRRMKELESAGVITGYRAVVDQAAVGLTISAFVLIDTDQRTETDQRLFLEAVREEPRILSCAAISGAHDFILEVAAGDIDDLADVTMTKLLGLPTVRDISSSIVYRWLKRHEPLPV